ncbi:MAG TPA: cupredoxin domain-containing protein [Candidatus Limnocylindrales bacterium]|jgi:plastocyanin
MTDLINAFFQFLEQLILPNWPDLIALLPWVLVAIVIVAMFGFVWAWMRTGARTRSRVPRRVSGMPPPGVHLPGPSRWPFVAPIGAALLLFSFALPPKDASGNATGPFNLQLFALGMIVVLIAVGGWLWDAMREWRATAEPQAVHGALPAGANAAAALVPAQSAALQRRRAFEAAEHFEPEEAQVAYVEPPPGVHMPGPSPWPFFVPIGATVMLYGFIFSSVLIVGGLILTLIALAGWYLEAGREYRSTEAVGHAVPATRDPYKAWPRRLVPIYFSVIAISVAITLAPIGISFLNSLTPAAATPTPLKVPAQPVISAKGVQFDTKTLVVPAGRPFQLMFNNNDAGVPHNVQIDDSSAKTTVLFDGNVITGVSSAIYSVPALPPGTYYFECKVHPNMNGTVTAVAEAGGAPAPSGAAPAPGGEPAAGNNTNGTSPAPQATGAP